MFIPQNIKLISDTLNNFGYDAYLVGGCVRDYLMNIPPKDYDITTNAAPEQILLCFKNFKTLTQGIKHGTITVMSQNEPVEITTYRIDGEYDDFRRPTSVTFSTHVRDDLSRRDFTVNAICYNEKDGYIDCFGGIDDIKNRIIRCVGDPEKRFLEDALRIMRALRFCSVLDFDIDESTRCAIHKLCHLLKNISYERITVELKKLLCGKRAGEILRDYADVFHAIIPQSTHLNADAFKRISKAIDNCDKNIMTETLGLCFMFCEFESSEDISNSLKQLKCSNETVNNVTKICIASHNEICDSDVFCKRLIQNLGYENAFLLLKLKSARDGSLNDKISVIYKKLQKMRSSNECVSVSQLDISGNELIMSGIPKGKEIGVILDTLLEEVITEKLQNTKQALLQRVSELYSKKEVIQ